MVGKAWELGKESVTSFMVSIMNREAKKKKMS
jgi:hypothetical protein